MAFCNKCGHQIELDSAFCRFCGAPVNPSSSGHPFNVSAAPTPGAAPPLFSVLASPQLLSPHPSISPGGQAYDIFSG